MKASLLLGSSLIALAAAVTQARATVIIYSGAATTYTVPVTGTYDIVVEGAQGGNRVASSGGLGAQVGGDLTLTAGTVLDVVVGGMGYGGAGGGGSFLYAAAGRMLLAVAGGGGGGSYHGGDGYGGRSQTSGGTPGGLGGSGGTGGSGGAGGTYLHVFNQIGNNGGGGGGWAGNGTAGAHSGSGTGGQGPTSFAGGTGPGNVGGFGGGGGAGFAGGGGGGGYSGGGGGSGFNFGNGGGGGGSFLSPAFTPGTTYENAGVNTGDGQIDITQVVATPEPASAALLAAGLAGVGLVRRRKTGS